MVVGILGWACNCAFVGSYVSGLLNDSHPKNRKCLADLSSTPLEFDKDLIKMKVSCIKISSPVIGRKWREFVLVLKVRITLMRNVFSK